MPITENAGGVLRTHAAEYENIGGVIREKSSVVVNDGGVLREIYSAKKASVKGITPLVSAKDHIVITESGSGTISLPAGARIILGSGAHGTSGGFVAEYTLTSPVINAPFTAVVGEANNRVDGATTLVIDGVTYSCGKVAQVIQSKWGPIGGNGASGGARTPGGSNGSVYDAGEPTGAGGGGGGVQGASSLEAQPSNGGNASGYGNKGGNGSGKTYLSGTAGSSGTGGASYGSTSHCGLGGGGGGFAAGGGRGGQWATTSTNRKDGSNGDPGAGIIVFEW